MVKAGRLVIAISGDRLLHDRNRGIAKFVDEENVKHWYYEMKKSKKEINSEIRQLIIIGKLHCDECEKSTPIEWEEWVCDYSGKEHPLNEDGESVCSDETCHPRDVEVTFEGMNINEATEYILQKEVHPRCAECASLYGW